LLDKYLMHQKIAQRLRKLSVAMVMLRVKNVKCSRDKIRMILKNKKIRNLSMPKNIMTEIYLQKPLSLDENHILQFRLPRPELQIK
jgi:hypothetical protein